MIPEDYQRHLEALRKYVRKLKELRERVPMETLRNPESVERDSLERNLQLALQSVLDIGAMIIADFRFGTPNDNEHIITILGNNGVLSPELAERVRYLYLNDEELFDAFEHRLDDFDRFAQEIVSYLDAHPITDS